MRRVANPWSAIGAVMFVVAATQGLAAPAPAPAPSSAPTVVGYWYGLGEPGDPEVFYIDTFNADGTFRGEYRKCQKGQLIYQQTQSGTWMVEDGVLTIHSTMINGKPGKFDHSYTIEMLSATEFRARLHDPDFLFVERRIPKFEFPPCYLGV
jgi:Lipocalin-like domain